VGAHVQCMVRIDECEAACICAEFSRTLMRALEARMCRERCHSREGYKEGRRSGTHTRGAICFMIKDNERWLLSGLTYELDGDRYGEREGCWYQGA